MQQDICYRLNLRNFGLLLRSKMPYQNPAKKYSSSQYYKKEDFSNSIPTGTGMYKVTKNDANMIELEKNNNWRNIETQNAKIEKIKIYKYASVGELYNNFKLGNIDFINTTNTNIQEYIGTIGFNLREYQGRGYNYLALNCNNKVLANKEVRQAINYAIDKNTIISKELSNNYFASNFILDYGSYLYQGNEENRQEFQEKHSPSFPLQTECQVRCRSLPAVFSVLTTH